jgi:tripartite-type tricarboxylate transporter receptor subunit TctC
MAWTLWLDPTAIRGCCAMACKLHLHKHKNKGDIAPALAGAAMAAEPLNTGPVKVIVPYGVGETGDVVARILGEKASAELAQPVVIDNRSDGTSTIGSRGSRTSSVRRVSHSSSAWSSGAMPLRGLCVSSILNSCS